LGLGDVGPALIDLGAGTGILSIAAAKLGAAPVLAVDIDADAVRVARANVARNQVDESVRVEQGSLADVLAGRYGLAQAPLVVANILAHVLVDFFTQGLVKTVTPGGLLILSGILRTQGPDIRARLGWQGLTVVAEEQQEEWLCVIARAMA
jgi:ribosomal protein L11 methyltransferase